jgi:hypothetical protein
MFKFSIFKNQFLQKNGSVSPRETLTELSMSPRSLSPKDRISVVRERKATMVLDKQRAIEELVAMRALKAEQKCHTDTQKFLLLVFGHVQAALAFRCALEDAKARKEAERVQNEHEAMMWTSALKIQRKWILTWRDAITNVLITNRNFNISERILERRHMMINKQYRLNDAARDVLRQRRQSVDILVSIIRLYRRHPFVLAKEYLRRVRNTQNFSRSRKSITACRIQLLSLVLENFYSELMIHINIINGGKLGFDMSDGDPVYIAALKYLLLYNACISSPLFPV